MIARQLARQQYALSKRGVRMLTSSQTSYISKGPGRTGPTNDSRTSPRSESTPSHPGYTPADTPISSDHPSTMPGPSPTAKIAGYTTQASTRPHPPHQGIDEMAKGAESGGEGAIKPEERNVKNWGPNAESAQFNPKEGKRNPIHHGGSNEAKGPSKG